METKMENKMNTKTNTMNYDFSVSDNDLMGLEYLDGKMKFNKNTVRLKNGNVMERKLCITKN